MDNKEQGQVAVQETRGNLPAVSEAEGIMNLILKAGDTMDPAKISQLMDLQERVLNRNAKMAFAAALSAMQSEMPEIEQSGAIMHGGKLISKYAKFEDINEAVKPVLQKHGFAISFRVKQPEGKIEVTAILSHREGHTEETSITLPADTSGAKNSVQAQGSSIAYGKRYAMCALLNITSRGEDDDAQSGGAITHEQAVEIDLLITEVKADKEKFLKVMGVDDVRKIPADKYQLAKDKLNQKKQAAKKTVAA